ncbi:hypothetical protein [Paenibacillus sp. MDMC362]|uniref:hypothetical protein n=1 Tax=Paenibacillus sp. MDMC362 TaxID=2977365 RepID=UPI000DC49509|nr:hypothetical protein [Paenibacillus sp. MDMC362]RAR44548.1 hypothetical protein DP091_07150 [Paenibacillus sp. MDMC362]
MEIELIPVTVQEKETLSNMYQFYYYDFSRYTNEDLNDDGTYQSKRDYEMIFKRLIEWILNNGTSQPINQVE